MRGRFCARQRDLTGEEVKESERHILHNTRRGRRGHRMAFRRLGRVYDNSVGVHGYRLHNGTCRCGCVQEVRKKLKRRTRKPCRLERTLPQRRDTAYRVRRCPARYAHRYKLFARRRMYRVYRKRSHIHNRKRGTHGCADSRSNHKRNCGAEEKTNGNGRRRIGIIKRGLQGENVLADPCFFEKSVLPY